MSPDPDNSYRYTGDSPTNWTDPTGLQVTIEKGDDKGTYTTKEQILALFKGKYIGKPDQEQMKIYELIAEGYADNQNKLTFSTIDGLMREAFFRLNVYEGTMKLSKSYQFTTPAQAKQGILITVPGSKFWEALPIKGANATGIALKKEGTLAQGIDELFDGQTVVQADCATACSLIYLYAYVKSVPKNYMPPVRRIGVTDMGMGAAAFLKGKVAIYSKAFGIAPFEFLNIQQTFFDELENVERKDGAPILGDEVVFVNPNLPVGNTWHAENTIFLGNYKNDNFNWYFAPGIGFVTPDEITNIMANKSGLNPNKPADIAKIAKIQPVVYFPARAAMFEEQGLPAPR